MSQLETVQAVLLAHAEQDTPALAFDDRRWTWREFVTGAAARAHHLASLMDAEKPRHVGTLLGNGPEIAFALAAGALGGHVTAGINATRRGAGLASDIRRTHCQVLLTDAEHLPLLEGLDLGGAQVILIDSPAWASALESAPRHLDGLPEVGTFDTFMLIFTSGTSGDPKAVQISNFTVIISGSTLVEKFGLSAEDVFYASMPMFHSNALLAGIAPAWWSGGCLAISRRFSASGFLDEIRGYGATYMNYVGKPLAYALATPEQPDDADNTLRVAFGNEAPDRDITEFGRRFGCTVWDGFGSTEAAVIIIRPDDTPLGSVGQPFDGVAVYNRVTGTECPRAVFDEIGVVTNLDEAVGELVNTHGGGWFGGYYNDESSTAERMHDGMYWSGDLAYRDDAGFVYLAGRTSDWLRVDGENLAAAPIEQILLRHPAISQPAVYGVPDPLVGDALMVALVLREDADLTPEEFAAFLNAQEDLSAKAWPRYVRIAEALPATATNKVLKRDLVRDATSVGADVLWERGARDRIYTAVSTTVTV